ncbi:MAG: PTS fructose transporter subunit IIA [Pseudomonadota bacterium]
MIGIVIVAHGPLANGYLTAMEHVVGAQPGIRAIAISADENRTTQQAEVCAAMNAVDDGDGVVLVTDLFGSSPSNLCVNACASENRHVLYGANLPMLVKLAKSRRKPIEIAVERAVTAGRKYLDCLSSGPHAAAQ